MKTPWIKKYYNDKRDYIVQEHEIEIPNTQVIQQPPEYELEKKYEVILVQDKNDFTGDITYYWYEESKNKKLSPAFATKEMAEYWWHNMGATK